MLFIVSAIVIWSKTTITCMYTKLYFGISWPFSQIKCPVLQIKYKFEEFETNKQNQNESVEQISMATASITFLKYTKYWSNDDVIKKKKTCDIHGHSFHKNE